MNRAWLLLVLLISGCASSFKGLSDTERAKLDPPLQRLLAGEAVNTLDYHSIPGEGGQPLYSVIIKGESLNQLERQGYRTGSIMGNMATAHLSVEQIVTLLRQPSIRSILNGGSNMPQQ
jgi:hypothetical protein